MAHQKNKNFYVVRDGDYMRGGLSQEISRQEMGMEEIRQHKEK